MNQIKKTEFSFEEIREQVTNSILVIKEYKKHLKLYLNMWKCYFTANEISEELFKNNTLQDSLKENNLAIDYYNPLLTLYSTLDPEISVSVVLFEDLLTDEAYDFFKKTTKEYKAYVQNQKSKN